VFASVGRRLALLNVAVVLLVIAVTGAGTWLLLRQSLIREADAALEDRIKIAQDAWEPRLAGEADLPTPATGGEDDHEDDGDESHEILASGDVLLFVFDRDGALIGNERGIQVEGVPVTGAVERALAGHDDTRTVEVDGERLRVRTEPVEDHGEVLGIIQAAQSEREHDAELRLVGLASLIGVGAGILIALPSGLFLSRRAMRPIDAAFHRQRSFVADASHELRTPLTVLRANAEMVGRMSDLDPAEVRSEMDEMLREIDTMTRLVNDLLALARVNDATGEVEMEAIDLREVAEAAARSLRPKAGAAGVTIAVDVPRHLTVTANRLMVEQVLRILLDNAVTYTHRGDTVTVSATSEEDWARICVQDHGPGIDPADQARVFDRFYRADPARARHTGGSGLGLAIARSLTLTLGGEIALDSAPNAGTTVCFTLPARA
jgi:signal transduction histidine kinase